jgi:trans-2,3-dihydro-3-hydroxyanthranilate isomerase
MQIRRYSFYTVDVFTEKIFGGNPLVVFPNAEGLSSKQMQQIAREFNISETVFVFPPTESKNDRQLRIFTPKTEIPFAGHPTLGTAYLLTTIDDISLDQDITNLNFEEGVGTICVTVKSQLGQSNYCEMKVTQPPTLDQAFVATEDLAQMLSLKKSDLVTGKNCQSVSCGLPFLFIPLTCVNALQKARLDLKIWQELLKDFSAKNIYLFTHSPQLTEDILSSQKTHLWRARMFAPALGIEEDPATGSAASAFGAYLASRIELGSGRFNWMIEQGFEMGRPSILQLETIKKDHQIIEMKVGGNCVLVSQGLINIPF